MTAQEEGLSLRAGVSNLGAPASFWRKYPRRRQSVDQNHAVPKIEGRENVRSPSFLVYRKSGFDQTIVVGCGSFFDCLWLIKIKTVRCADLILNSPGDIRVFL